MTDQVNTSDLTFEPAAIERAVVKYLEAVVNYDRLKAANGPEWGFTAEARAAARVISRRHGAVSGAAKRAKVFTSYPFWDKMIARQKAVSPQRS